MRAPGIRTVLGLGLTLAALVTPVTAQDFVNFETPHVHPLDMTPDGSLLLAVNTADNRLELFDLSGGTPVPAGSISVGLDPVGVRARTNGEAWVANHLGDTVSVVDLATLRVKATLDTSDEPCDIVFAGTPERAFVSCSQANEIHVFDPTNLSAAATVVPLVGEDPRELAVSPDGSTVYAAIFESGNNTTILAPGMLPEGAFPFPHDMVGDPVGPHFGENPPPNNGAVFEPLENPLNDAPPHVGLIVRKGGDGAWRDDTGADWTPWVSGEFAAVSQRPEGWDMADHDVAQIDADTLAVSYHKGLMNLNMALGVNPVSGELAVVGTEALNWIRFEPNLQGVFIRVWMAVVDPTGFVAPAIADLNPHLDYTSPTVPQALRDQSLGDPRSVAFKADGSKAYVAGMGSNNLIVVDAAGARAGLAPTIEVGEGPTGVVVDDARGQLYVMNKFEGSLSVVDLGTELETSRVPFFDPTPDAIKDGRPFLYSTHDTSGLGHLACASCHVDGRWDRLAWDLGNPAGDMIATPNGQNWDANHPFLGNVTPPDFHPMKGPLTTQTLQDIIGKEPFHWRGDKDGLEDFNGAFVGLQGDDTMLTVSEMQAMEDFLATIHYPPNPYRELDNSLSTSVPLPGHFATGRYAPAGDPLPVGDATAGMSRFMTNPPPTLGGCTKCHTFPVGAGTDTTWNGSEFVPIPVGPRGGHHLMLLTDLKSKLKPMKVAQLRSTYEKTGFNLTQDVNTAGFGLTHDGAIDSIERDVTILMKDGETIQDVANLVAFIKSFPGSDLPLGSPTEVFHPPGQPSLDAHAAVGKQQTVDTPLGAPGQAALVAAYMAEADLDRVGLVVKGVRAGEPRGWTYQGGDLFQSDRDGETETSGSLLAGAAVGSELTFTVVPEGSETRIGIDRDLDGFFDRDELDAGSDPADAGDVPGGWTDLGQGLAGTYGIPQLTGEGSLLPLTDITLTLSGALESSAFIAIGGFSEANVWFFGGTLVPFPDILIQGLPTGPAGTLPLSAEVPASGFPPGQDIYFQFWVWDGAAPAGLAATNALRATAP